MLPVLKLSWNNMAIIITKYHPNYQKHRALVIGRTEPGVLARIFLGRKGKAFAYIGKGTEWYHYKPATRTKQNDLVKLGAAESKRFSKALNRFLTFKKIFA